MSILYIVHVGNYYGFVLVSNYSICFPFSSSGQTVVFPFPGPLFFHFLLWVGWEGEGLALTPGPPARPVFPAFWPASTSLLKYDRFPFGNCSKCFESSPDTIQACSQPLGRGQTCGQESPRDRLFSVSWSVLYPFPPYRFVSISKAGNGKQMEKLKMEKNAVGISYMN